MQRLKTYLRHTVSKEIEDSQEKLSDARRANRAIGKTDINDVEYRVHLQTLWDDHGEKNICLDTTGTIEDAVKAAEQQFRRVNKRKDIQARYGVAINLDGVYVSLPETYWKKYKSRR